MKRKRIYGYVRVSTREQNEARQMEAMRKLCIPEENIYIDKQSGKDFDRPAYLRLKARLRPGDTLYVLSLDRLGRNYYDVLEQWRILTKIKRVCMVVIDMPLLDTRDKGKDLTGMFVSDMVLQILSYVAQNERESIRRRQAEGIKAARDRGVRFGRPKKDIPDNFPEIVARWRRKEITESQALAESGMGHTRFYYTIHKLGL